MTGIQQQVQEAIDRLVESGAERGLQVAVYRDGEQVVDAVAGVADPESGRPDQPPLLHHQLRRPRRWTRALTRRSHPADTRRHGQIWAANPSTVDSWERTPRVRRR